jgi:hypothetical protein
METFCVYFVSFETKESGKQTAGMFFCSAKVKNAGMWKKLKSVNTGFTAVNEGRNPGCRNRRNSRPVIGLFASLWQDYSASVVLIVSEACSCFSCF